MEKSQLGARCQFIFTNYTPKFCHVLLKISLTNMIGSPENPCQSEKPPPLISLCISNHF